MTRGRLVWTAVLVLAALGGAGIATAADRASTDEQRPELTWRAEQAAAPVLANIRAELDALAEDADRLAQASRGLLSALPALDAATADAALQSGNDAAAALAEHVSALTARRAEQQQIVADARLSRATRAGLLALDEALADAAALPETWLGIAARGGLAVDLLNALAEHDRLILDATAAGRDADWVRALELIDAAEQQLALARAARDALAAGGDVTTLDDLLGRYAAFDAALADLYAAIERTGSDQGAEIDALRTEVERARAALPQTGGALSIAVSDAAGDRIPLGVVAIEQARGAIADARAALAED